MSLTLYNFLSISVQFSHSVVSNSVTPCTEHTRLPCPSVTPGACSNSCPSSWWYHPTISSSIISFSCLQSFLASGSFPVRQFFTSCGQSIGASASTSTLSMNTYYSMNTHIHIHNHIKALQIWHFYDLYWRYRWGH